jgi:hypothetical protein
MLLVRIDVSEPGADDDRLDVLAGRLGGSLVEAVPGAATERPAAGAAPAGVRGTLETVGAVLVTVQASVELFRAVHAAVRDWLDRTPSAAASSSLTLRVGEARVDIAGLPPDKQAELIAGIISILDEDDDRD